MEICWKLNQAFSFNTTYRFSKQNYNMISLAQYEVRIQTTSASRYIFKICFFESSNRGPKRGPPHW